MSPSIVSPRLLLCLFLAVGALVLFGIYVSISRTFIEPAEERKLARLEAIEEASRERARREERRKEKQENEKEQRRARENAVPLYIASINNTVMFANFHARRISEVKALNVLQQGLTHNSYWEARSVIRSSRADFAETISASRKARHEIEVKPLPPTAGRLTLKSLKLWRNAEAQVQEMHAERAEVSVRVNRFETKT